VVAQKKMIANNGGISRVRPKFVYFDVGGVLIDDFSGNDKLVDLLCELGVTEANRLAFDQIWVKYKDRVCIDLDVDEALVDLREAGFSIPQDYSLLRDGFVKRFYRNEAIWPVVDGVDVTRVGLLTNMYVRMLDGITEAGLLPPGVSEWQVVVDSSKVGLQKPDREIFELATQMSGYEPAEILFIDNTEEHVLAARQNGWQAFLYDSSDHVGSSKALQEYLSS
jgi:FMN phosphatase YigB (HAD superfamily)